MCSDKERKCRQADTVSLLRQVDSIFINQACTRTDVQAIVPQVRSARLKLSLTKQREANDYVCVELQSKRCSNS